MTKIMNFINFEEAKKIKWDIEVEKVPESVVEIIDKVKNEGDSAVIFYSQKYDEYKRDNIRVSDDEIKKAYEKVSLGELSALKSSARNIEKYARKQMSLIKGMNIEIDNVKLGYKIIPIQRVGCCVPGGVYPLPSSALMSVIPAKIAGVKEIIVCSPKIKPITVVAAHLAGADEIYGIGGVQAVAAMAYGTETIKKVNKIVGPGNDFVAAAKKEVHGRIGIDFIAGPSEVLIIADKTANPRYIAADLLAQAEHDKKARANVIILSEKLEEKIQKEIEKQLEKLETRKIAGESISKGNIILVKNLEQAIELSEIIAPEHLELQIKNAEENADKFTNYGSLFIGEYSAEVFGDYCSGTNHILPTGGSAKYTSGVSVFDFIKRPTYQIVKKQSLPKLIDTASKMAKAEGMFGHKNAADVRR
jgi:histidinol dehydrogenase